mmetsp:Transcript_11200/g.24085  ORF Transcript_11200/g.24085 Transcript_11200/m.24085 type:complete len:276 (-) Transcript_11200:81-908(-)
MSEATSLSETVVTGGGNGASRSDCSSASSFFTCALRTVAVSPEELAVEESAAFSAVSASTWACSSLLVFRIVVHCTCSFWNLSVSSLLRSLSSSRAESSFGSCVCPTAPRETFATGFETDARALSCGTGPPPVSEFSHCSTSLRSFPSSVDIMSVLTDKPDFSTCSKICLTSKTVEFIDVCRSFLIVVRTRARSPSRILSTSSLEYMSSKSLISRVSLNSAATSATQPSRLRLNQRTYSTRASAWFCCRTSDMIISCPQLQCSGNQTIIVSQQRY